MYGQICPPTCSHFFGLNRGGRIGKNIWEEFLIFLVLVSVLFFMGFPGGSDGKESACNAGDPGSLLGWEDLLEEGMATHSSTLAWRIPWTEEPGRL